MLITKGEVMFTNKDHMFVLCAYKENPHLENSIKSLLGQTVKTKIAVSTSTPNDYIKNICDKYNLPLFINNGKAGIGYDWNYAYNQANTKLVTIAHQDDIYEPEYIRNILHYANKREDAIIIYTDYCELRNGVKTITNKLLKIKRIMNWPLSLPFFYRSRFVRRRILSFGCPICCPAVTIVKMNAGDTVYDSEFKNSCDYRTWVRLSKNKGSYIYINKKLFNHRIYAESTTTQNLNDNIRAKEDFKILCEFWPKPIAKMINSVYCTSEKSNEL